MTEVLATIHVRKGAEMDDHWSDVRFGIYYRIRNARKIERAERAKSRKALGLKTPNQRKGAKRAMFRKSPLCHWCGMKLHWDDCSLEHIKPLSEGGDDSDDNLSLSCKRFNNERSNGRAKPCGQEDDEETKVMTPHEPIEEMTLERAQELLAGNNRDLNQLVEFAKKSTGLRRKGRGKTQYLRHVITLLSEQARVEEKRVELDVKMLNWLPDHIPMDTQQGGAHPNADG